MRTLQEIYQVQTLHIHSLLNLLLGNNNVVVRNSDNTQSQTLPLNLGNIELNKIGNYQDYIYKNNDKWYKKEVIGKVVLNGTEASNSFTLNSNLSTTDYTCFFYGNNLIAKAENDTTISAMSNRFKGTASNQRTTNITNCWLNHLVAGQLGFHIQNTITTVNDLKTWLVSNNTTFYYLLATATDIEITDTQLIEQLNEIEKMKSYNGTTIITSTYDSNNAQMILSASALKGE